MLRENQKKHCFSILYGGAGGSGLNAQDISLCEVMITRYQPTHRTSAAPL
jgi:hypothetical protein